MNEWLWLAMLAANFVLILLFYRVYGKTGLYVWIPIATIIANIQVIKVVDLFGFEATLGNIVYASSFLVTDILSENYGKKAANKAVFIGFLSLLSLTGLMSLALKFQPSEADFIQGSLANIFGFMPRLELASFSAYLVAQLHDVWAYHFWKKRIPGMKHIWLRNNASTMVSQFLDTTIFTFIAFYGVHDWPVLVSIFWTTYVLKWVVAALDTPLVYLARWGYEKGIFEK
ncbi:queuosine precursor transporter [bacterium]|nr:queuosine precursor transporter [bacterium]